MSSFETKVSRKVNRGLALGLGLSAIFAGAPSPGLAEGTVNQCPDLVGATTPAARKADAEIKHAIVNHRRVRFDASHGVLSSGSDDMACETVVPITKGGKFYALEQTGRSFRSLKVVELPAPVTVIDESFPQLNDPNAVPSTTGVVTVNTVGHDPAVRIRYSDGETLLANIGDTSINQN